MCVNWCSDLPLPTANALNYCNRTSTQAFARIVNHFGGAWSWQSAVTIFVCSFHRTLLVRSDFIINWEYVFLQPFPHSLKFDCVLLTTEGLHSTNTTPHSHETFSNKWATTNLRYRLYHALLAVRACSLRWHTNTLVTWRAMNCCSNIIVFSLQKCEALPRVRLQRIYALFVYSTVRTSAATQN